MKRNIYFLSIAVLLSFTLVCCDGNNSTKTDQKSKQDEKTEEVKKESVVICDNQIVMLGPGEDFGGVVDAKASEIMGIETYSAVWKDYKVRILEEKDAWAKIETIERPNTISGWIPSSCIE